jgi:hypothetical protein
MGRIGNVQCAARHFARPNALQHLFVTAAASLCDAFLDAPMPGAK